MSEVILLSCPICKEYHELELPCHEPEVIYIPAMPEKPALKVDTLSVALFCIASMVVCTALILVWPVTRLVELLERWFPYRQTKAEEVRWRMGVITRATALDIGIRRRMRAERC